MSKTQKRWILLQRWRLLQWVMSKCVSVHWMPLSLPVTSLLVEECGSSAVTQEIPLS